ncbi:MAG: hypothetical protein ABEJ58_05300 [Halodesulfurarchaeum sp.]
MPETIIEGYVLGMVAGGLLGFFLGFRLAMFLGAPVANLGFAVGMTAMILGGLAADRFGGIVFEYQR